MKERIGDAIRNAAMRFGIALDLWSKEELESTLAEPTLKIDKPTAGLMTNDQKSEIFNLLTHLGVPIDEMTEHVRTTYSLGLKNINHAEADDLLEMLRKDAARSLEPTV
jgi:hypothetical protein